MDEGAVLPLIKLIYEGTLDDTHWRSALLEINNLFPASTSALIFQTEASPTIPYVLVEGGERDTAALYAESMYWHDPFVNLPEGQVILVDDLVSEDEWQKSEFYRLCVAPAGLRFFMGIDTSIGVSHCLKIRLGRTDQQGQFTAKDKDLLLGISAHLNLAMKIKSKLGYSDYQQETHSHALERFSVGTLVINDAMDIVSIDSKAQEIVHGHTNLRIVNRRVKFTDSTTQKALERGICALVHQIKNGKTGLSQFLRVEEMPGTAGLKIAIRPLDWSRKKLISGGSLHFGLYISQPTTSISIDPEAIGALFKLTKMESKLSQLLVEGYTLEPASEMLGIKTNTGRAHLRSIFIKTGVSRQAQLVALILSGIAGL